MYRVVAPLLALLFLLVTPVLAADEVVRLPAEPLVIETASGNEVTFDSEIADDDAELRPGPDVQ